MVPKIFYYWSIGPADGAPFAEKGLRKLEDSQASGSIFARFDFYASYVKYLDIYGPKGETFKVLGWKVLTARTRQKVLLPNLHTLTIRPTNAPTDQLTMWVGTFSSPSLVNLLITDGNLWDALTVSYWAASSIMKSLAAAHPKLERLELFPSSELDDDYVDEGEDDSLVFPPGDPFYKYTEHFANLKRLACTFAWFRGPALRVLGQLPHLEALDVCGIDKLGETSVELSEDSFPSLRSLYLHYLSPTDARRTLKMTQMVRALTSLRIDLNTEDLIYTHVNHETRQAMREFFSLLLNVPHLTALWIDLDPNGDLVEAVEIDKPDLGVLQPLPLKSLRLGQVFLSDDALQLNLALVWPSVTRLSIPQQPASLALLSRFAVLPELLHLELQLNLDELELEYDKTASALTVLQASPDSSLCLNFSQAGQIIRALLNIFPNLTRMNWPSDQQSVRSDFEPAHEPKYEHISFMNGHRAALFKILVLEKARLVARSKASESITF
ncbi:hypothetical protein FRC12_001864 [Ceratobasidium sp. 428]|nr:hypothetical protein FRC12_001864 [Ceratobasidium sp. 428]